MKEPLKQSWIQLLSIQSGAALCLPLMMIGQILCQRYGWVASLWIIGFSNFFLLLLGIGFALLSTDRPKSTVQHIVYYCGAGSRFGFSLIMMVAMVSWFAVQNNLMTLSLIKMLSLFGYALHPLILNCVIGVILSLVMCFGMKTLEWVSNLSIPIFLLTFSYELALTKGTMPEAAPLSLSFCSGISLMIGGSIVSVIDLPTFFQHARSRKDACLAVIFLYGLIVPSIESLGLYFSALRQGESFLEMLHMGHGLYGQLWICFFVMLCGWTTNNSNLYSAVISSSLLFQSLSFSKRVMILGLLGSFIACFNPMGNFQGILDVLGVALGSIGAVILGNYFLELTRHKIIKTTSLMSWACGVASGTCSFFFHLSLTSFFVLDAFLIAALMQIGLTVVYQRIYEINS